MAAGVLVEQAEKKATLKFWGVGAFVVLAMVLDHYYGPSLLIFRLLAWLLVLAVSAGVLYTTPTGEAFVSFMRQAVAEMYKVVWPTRQETLQTAIVVVLMVVAMGALLWLIDTLWFYLVGLVLAK